MDNSPGATRWALGEVGGSGDWPGGTAELVLAAAGAAATCIALVLTGGNTFTRLRSFSTSSCPPTNTRTPARPVITRTGRALRGTPAFSGLLDQIGMSASAASGICLRHSTAAAKPQAWAVKQNL